MDSMTTQQIDRDLAERAMATYKAAVEALRIQLAEVTAERDRLREALGLAAKALHLVGHGAPGNSRWRSADFGIRQHCTNAAMAANTALSAPPEPKPEAPKCEPVEFHMGGLRMAKCKNCGRENYAHKSLWQTECNGTGRAQ